MNLSNKAYDIIKMIQRWLPLIATLYVALASIWGLPLADEISKTIMAIATFLAGVLEIATAKYNATQNESPELDDDEISNHEVEEGVG